MYEGFAQVYDELMDDVPYEEWAELIHKLILKYGVSRPVRKSDCFDQEEEEASTVLEKALIEERNLVLDLACGSGTLTELMYRKGYDMIGVDSSSDMLNMAMEKRDLNGSEILYLNQDMRELDLYSTVGTVYCACDSINYLLTDEDLLKVFGLVKNYLFTGGIFIFDFNTELKYRLIGDSTIAENRDDVSFIWENFYDGESRINEYDLTLFIRMDDTLYEKLEEIHIQRGYLLSEIKELLQRAGFKILELIDPDESATRIFVVAGV